MTWSPAPVRSRRLAADDSMSKKAMHFGATRAESAGEADLRSGMPSTFRHAGQCEHRYTSDCSPPGHLEGSGRGRSSSTPYDGSWGRRLRLTMVTGPSCLHSIRYSTSPILPSSRIASSYGILSSDSIR